MKTYLAITFIVWISISVTFAFINAFTRILPSPIHQMSTMEYEIYMGTAPLWRRVGYFVFLIGAGTITPLYAGASLAIAAIIYGIIRLLS